MLQTRPGMLEMMTFPGGTGIGKDNVQGMTTDWVGQWKRSLELRRSKPLKGFEGSSIWTLKQPTEMAGEW